MITGRASLVSWTVGAVEASFAAAELSAAALRNSSRSVRESSMVRIVAAPVASGAVVMPETTAGCVEIHHHPGAARREEAVAVGGDQPFLAASGLGRQVEGDLRQVDDDPVRALHDGDLRRRPPSTGSP